MVKITNSMFKSSKVFLLLFLLNTVLFPSVVNLEKAIIKQGKLNLVFSHPFKKSNINHFTLKKPDREIYDLKNTRLAHGRVPLGLGPNVRITQNNNNNTVRIAINGVGNKSMSSQPFFSGKECHISLPKKSGNALPTERYKKSSVESRANDSYSQRRSHRSELVVIDAGHGGHDAGAVVGGKREKDVVLQIAKKLEAQLKKRGYAVHMTRRKDDFLKLPQRTKIADQKNAVVFISIHANSVSKNQQNKVQGVETFFLQKTRDARSQRIAERENKSVLKGTTQLSRSVILDSVLSGPKIVQSNKLAIDVHRRIMTNLRSRYSGVKDGGVRHAPFWVLVGASRPSILIEVGYISHPTERTRLFTPRYQELLAKGIAEGVDNYLDNRKKEIDF